MNRHGPWRAPLGIALGAIVLRLLLFIGRGDYIAYDEAWYLLLGRNLFVGDGYTLSGLRHVALSPLFPVVAGAVSTVVGDAILAGRIVAAAASGLVVVPAWSIFRRFAGRRTALLACAIVAVLPALAPFVAPYWVGWDLYVGAEPLLHLLLYGGIALVLRALERRRALDWALAGGTFALAYLARPEAIVPFGLLGLAAVGLLLRRRRPRQLPALAAGALAFALVASPYWLHLRETTGRWALTGRGVRIELPGAERRAGDGDAPPDATIERMLWRGEHGRYVRRLYALHPSGTRLASTYWGVPDEAGHPTDAAAEVEAGGPGAGATTGDGPDAGGTDAVATAADDRDARGTETSETGAGEIGAASEPTPPPHGLVLYARAIEMIVPWFLLPFLALGLLLPGRRRRLDIELPVMGSLAATSALIAAMVAADPRTQTFLAPLLAFYVARGLRAAGIWMDRRSGEALRRGFAATLLPAVALVILLGVDARRLYMATTVGSLHQIGATENRRAGEVLREIVPEDEPVMSWHPAIALHAHRDWRVLPIGSFPEIVRYARAIGCRHIVLSFYYPSPLASEQFPRPYIALRVPPDAPADAERWRIAIVRTRGNVAFGRVLPDAGRTP